MLQLKLIDISSGRARVLYRRLYECHLPLQPQYPVDQAEIPFPGTPPILYSTFWTRHTFLNGAIRVVQCRL